MEMDQLLLNLQSAYRKHTSDSVWNAAGSAQHALAAFRAQADSNALEFRHTPAPHYVFDPYRESPPAGATFGAADWERYADFVLDVLRASTGMRVQWPGKGQAIELHLPQGPGEAPPSGASGLPRDPGHPGGPPGTLFGGAPPPGPGQWPAGAAPLPELGQWPAGAAPPPELGQWLAGLKDGAFRCVGGAPAPPCDFVPPPGGTLDVSAQFALTASFDPKPQATPPAPKIEKVPAAAAPPAPTPKTGGGAARADNLAASGPSQFLP